MEDPLAGFSAPSLDQPDSLAYRPPQEEAPTLSPNSALAMELFGPEDEDQLPGIGGISRDGAVADDPTAVGVIPPEVQQMLSAPPPGGALEGPAFFSPSDAEPSPVPMPAITRDDDDDMVPPSRWGGSALKALGALAAVGALGAGLLLPLGQSRPLGELLAERVMRMAAGAELAPSAVRVTSWPVPGEDRPLLLVLGQVSNANSQAAPAVLIRVEFKDVAGRPIRQAEGYAGRLMEELDLTALLAQADGLKRLPEAARQLAAKDLAPGESWPFMVMVPNPPDALGQGEITVTAHRADPPALTRTTPLPKLELNPPPPPPPAKTPPRGRREKPR